MSKMRFSDGLEIETSGSYRIVEMFDGYYVIGHGMLCPVGSEAEGKTLIALLSLHNQEPRT